MNDSPHPIDRLLELSSRLSQASPGAVEDLLDERQELIESLGALSESDQGLSRQAHRLADQARLPLTAQRELLRSQIQELERTKANLQPLRPPKRRTGVRLDLTL